MIACRSERLIKHRLVENGFLNQEAAGAKWKLRPIIMDEYFGQDRIPAERLTDSTPLIPGLDHTLVRQF